VNTVSSNGDTPLLIASSNGNLEAVRILMSHKPDVNFKDSNGNSALLKASQNGFFDVVEELIRGGANIRKLRTSLMVAAENGYIRVVKLLIKMGAKIATQDKYGKTALDI
ncbi:hypothetical protein PIROE2DRAFT_35287, partial [Piromyces sp. E2]